MLWLRKPVIWIVLGCFVAALGVGWYFYPAAATAQNSCPLRLPASAPLAEQARCAQEKEAERTTRLATQRATALALPRPTSIVANFQPVKLTPTADEMKIEQLPLEAMFGGPPYLRDLTSAWSVGVVPNATGTFLYSMYVVAKPSSTGNATIERHLLGGGDAYAEQYRHVWTAPEPVGKISITAISGQNGVVTFTSTSGKQGTLDMATGQWTLNP